MMNPFASPCLLRRAAACSLVLLFGLTPAVRGELSLLEYRRMQRGAAEQLQIEVLDVQERPVRDREWEVIVVAKVLQIHRTLTQLHEGDTIRIVYPARRRERAFAGPREPKVLERGKSYPAYLTKNDDGRTFRPAAGALSFENLLDRRQ